MRIAVINSRYSLNKGGAERYCVNLCRSLKSVGHDVSVIGEQIDDDLTSEVNFLPVSVRNRSSWTKNWSFCVGADRASEDRPFDIVLALGRAISADVFHVTTRIHAHWMGIRYPGSLQSACQHLNPRHRMLLRIERAILHEAPRLRKIVTQCQLDKQLLIDLYDIPEHKIDIVYNGVDTSVFNPSVKSQAARVRAELGIERDQPLLVFASASDFKTKGLVTVFRSLQQIRNQDAKLLVIGAGSSRFARLASDMGIGHRVIFAGYQRHIQWLYGAADLFVLPSAYEPFPNVNLEAMACGVPVLTSATNGTAEIIDEFDNGYLVEDGEAAQPMAELLDHHFGLSTAERDRMAQRCWGKARAMTLERHAEAMVRLFEEVRSMPCIRPTVQNAMTRAALC